MTTIDRINLACDQFAAALSDFIIGGAKVGDADGIGCNEAATATGRDPETVRSYCHGRTTPTVQWLATLSAKFGRAHPDKVRALWRAFAGVAGGTFEPKADLDPEFLDADGDGDVDEADATAHRLKAAGAVCEGDDDEAKVRLAAAAACKRTA